jgi:hypothetical protein
MKSRVLLIISLLLMVSSTIQAQIPVEVSGYITSLETGFAVTDKEVSILTSSGQTAPTAITNNNGYYSILLDMLSIDSSATITVSVTDCLQEHVTRTFPVFNAAQIQADFHFFSGLPGCIFISVPTGKSPLYHIFESQLPCLLFHPLALGLRRW